MLGKEKMIPKPDDESKLLSCSSSKSNYSVENEWKLPGFRGTWLAPGVAQNLKVTAEIDQKVAMKDDEDRLQSSTTTSNSQTRRSSRKVQRKVLDESFTFY
mmetsp:Transcript_34594/g.72956  ORF Transcript_34594/g.72956 Transcript_34594/m.72956 type:complete len:101 (+) Transcript_34594:1-303(+)